MSKARTLADFISDGSEFADGTISVAEVSGAAPLASPTFTGNVDLGDDVRIRLGNSDDLQLYHENSPNPGSYIIENGTAALNVQGTNIIFKNSDGSKRYADFNDGGAVELHYADATNGIKLSTAADGVDITGDVGATTATITGKTTTDELDLNALAATISDTAVDIFVYDTRKDSDGGAWRKRTQHTSWYNETLNTATRGSRKEFPSVAVIVAEADTVTIYDGDDPDLPMWMVFNAQGAIGSASNIITANADVTSIVAMNGIMCFGMYDSTTPEGVFTVSFISEVSRCYRTVGSGYTGAIYTGSISTRNNNRSYEGDYNQLAIVDQAVNDVAMTVLPNAPIDAATGLPVPTIAVATEGGVSVIKDDGTVVDGVYLGGNSDSHTVALSSNGKIAWTQENGPYFLGELWSADWSEGTGINVGGDINGGMFYPAASTSHLSSVGLNTTCTIDAAGSSAGLTKVHVADGEDAFTNGMVNFITSDYNTGWMNGDIKLATLSDTDDTDVTGSELVTNGTFDSDTSGWTAAFSTISVTSGTLQVVGTGNFNYATQTVTGLTVGKKYVFQADIVTGSGNTYIYVRRGDNGGGITNGSANGVGSYALTFEAPTTSVEIRLYQIYQTTSTFDNVSIRLAEEDRSVNGNGLQVFGSITKDPVATGADLVAYSYSSSSTSNYLMQPYNSDLAFGTGDFSVMFWTKAADYTPNGSGTNFVLSLDAALGGVTGKGGISIASSTANDLRFQIYQNGYQTPGRIDCIDTDAIPTNTWNCICAVRRSGVFEIWLNGKLKATNAANLTADVSNLNTDGWHILSSNQGGVSMALLRASATAPSPEQIKKIYEDEKVLFQENAQATLYGDSDAVTALAYDDSTELLHVGTSAGRSVFQGLRRVDNTTTAVGAAISASNGLVADE